MEKSGIIGELAGGEWPVGPCGKKCWNAIKIGYCDHCIHNPVDPRTQDNYSVG